MAENTTTLSGIGPLSLLSRYNILDQDQPHIYQRKGNIILWKRYGTKSRNLPSKILVFKYVTLYTANILVTIFTTSSCVPVPDVLQSYYIQKVSRQGLKVLY